MRAPLYFLHGEPDDVNYIDSRTPEERANEPEVVTFTTTDGPTETVWLSAKEWAVATARKERTTNVKPERRRRMPEHWVSRQVIVFLSGFAIGAWAVAAAVMWL